MMGADYFETRSRSTPTGARQANLGVGKNCHIRRAIIDKNTRIATAPAFPGWEARRDLRGGSVVVRDGVSWSEGRAHPTGTVV